MTNLKTMTREELEASHASVRASFMAAKGEARKELRAPYKAVLQERDRRAWNSSPVEARAQYTVDLMYQGEEDWYPAGQWSAFQCYLDGALTAVEACEIAGIDLGDR